MHRLIRTLLLAALLWPPLVSAIPASPPDNLPTNGVVLHEGMRPNVQPAAQNFFSRDTISSPRWKLVLAVLGLLFLLARGKIRALTPARADRLLAVLGVLAGLSYFNFGYFHFGKYIHNWDSFHYYIGAKYFRELGYERLYECTAVADAEDGLTERVAQRKLTNLHNNVLEPSTEILAHPERCKTAFSEDRWHDFKHDVAFFRERETHKRWDDMQTDHGFNATPVWSIAGSVLANLAPATHAQVLALTILDPLYWLATCAVIAWAFGWRVLCLALLVFATFFPARFFWTGGSFLRWDWLFYSIAGIACLKKDRPLLGGFALGYAMLLRVFPGILFAGPLLLVAGTWLRQKRWDKHSLQFCLGGAMAVMLLVPVSLLSTGRTDVYQNFVRNSLKHASTPLTNHMGLRTVLSYRPAEVGRLLRSDKLLDPWQNWKQARLRAFGEIKPLFVLLVLGFGVLLWQALRNAEPWAAAALAAMLIAVCFELTCYYYAFILVVALLVTKQPRYGLWLLALCAYTGLVVTPLPFMPRWNDERYTLMSFVTLVVFAAILWDFGRTTSLIQAGPVKPIPERAAPHRPRRRAKPNNRRRR